ncbi:MAG: energy transducer TonB [Verrucomicrobia bacterium]|nr:MAG: energy transducer TonB [Verrucomicrobiota bacterium]
MGAILLTLAVFLVLPLTQMVSSRVQRLRMVTRVETTRIEPESPQEQTPPPPPAEPPPEPPPPALDDAPPALPLNISLDVALGGGGAYGGLGAGFWDNVAGQSAVDAFDVVDLEKPPELLSVVPPNYPPALRKAGIEGRVVVVFVLDEEGRVQDPRIESSTRPEFEAPALEAIRRWRFRPGMKDGRPVRTYLRQPIRFAIPR